MDKNTPYSEALNLLQKHSRFPKNLFELEDAILEMDEVITSLENAKDAFNESKGSGKFGKLAQSSEEKVRIPRSTKTIISAKILNHERIIRKIKSLRKEFGDKAIVMGKKINHGVRLDIMREKVKDPLYYKKYGVKISASIEKLFNNQKMKDLELCALNELAEKLAEAKGQNGTAISVENEIRLFLQKYHPDLLIRMSGNIELKRQYFDEFLSKLEQCSRKH